ncbi:MAG: WD40 repeat domain-containing protein [Fimbriimonas sp.]
MSILAAALAFTPTLKPETIQVALSRVVPNLRPIAFAPAPTGALFIACMEDGSVRIMDGKTRQTVRELDKHPQPAYAAAWSADGNLVATGDETARIWIASSRSGAKLKEYRTHTRGIQKLSFNVGANMLISTGKDDQINVYEIDKAGPKEARVILGKGANFYGAAFSPKLPSIFTTGMLGAGGRIYDASNGQVKGFITGHNNQGMFDVDYNLAGTRAVSAGRDGNAIVWDMKTDLPVGTLKGHKDWVVDVAYSPNGKLIATSSTDQTVKVWNAVTLAKVADIAAQSYVGSPLCFTADGSTLVTVNDQGYLQFNSVTPAQPAPTATPVKKAPAKKAPVKRAKSH